MLFNGDTRNVDYGSRTETSGYLEFNRVRA